MLLLPNLCAAQKIHFTDTCNHWKLFFQVIETVSGGSEYFFGNDTIVNGRTYRQFKYYHYPFRYYVVREDTMQKKVFALDLSDTDTSEKVVYDYGLTINDTFRCDAATHYVKSVDSVLIGTVQHRVWEMKAISCDSCGGSSEAYDYIVIEGIGSITEPLGPLYPVYFESGYFLACFRQCGEPEPFDRKIGWTFDNSSSCVKTYGVGLPDLNMTTNGVGFRPNPAGELLTVTTVLPIRNLVIADMLGRILIAPMFGQPTTNTTIDISRLSEGVYLIKVDGISVGRFVKR